MRGIRMRVLAKIKTDSLSRERERREEELCPGICPWRPVVSLRSVTMVSGHEDQVSGGRRFRRRRRRSSSASLLSAFVNHHRHSSDSSGCCRQQQQQQQQHRNRRFSLFGEEVLLSVRLLNPNFKIHHNCHLSPNIFLSLLFFDMPENTLGLLRDGIGPSSG